jgi:Family of unknown function (DUF5709)
MSEMSGGLDEVDHESDQLDSGDTLDDRGVADVLDEGYSPPERPWTGSDFGTTAREEATGESLDGRLARELPDDGAEDADVLGEDTDVDGLGDTSDTDGELLDDEVGETRSGRLVAPDHGGYPDEGEELFAEDIGVDGAGASAEEAAVHVVSEESSLDGD